MGMCSALLSLLSGLWQWASTQGLIAAAYFAFGAFVYDTLEGWEPLDSCYFLMVTVTTVGYGDFVPVTRYGRLFTCVYALVGMT
eukprot:6520513-Prymnesium_polylepis.1